MIRNYLAVAIRNLARNKNYLFINTLGLGIALACCITAYLLIAYNLEYDHYFRDADVNNVVKVVQNLENVSGASYKELTAPFTLGPVAASEISGISQFTRYCSARGNMSYGDKAFSETVFFSDANFFNMFRFSLVNGSLRNFLNKESIFISAQYALKYFGDKDPVGKTIVLHFGKEEKDLIVGGVFDKIPLNTSFIPNVLVRMENLPGFRNMPDGNWNSETDVSLLFEIINTDQIKNIAGQLNKYINLRNLNRRDSKLISFSLIPFKENIMNGEVRQSDIHLPIPLIALMIFSSMGLLILLIACFNLTNTTLGLTYKRMKEIGIRKVVGSGRWQIICQFLLEMVITILIALVAAFGISKILVPQFALMWRLNYGLGDLSGTNLVIMMIIILIVSSLLAGMYPAIVNSRQRPLVLFKGSHKLKGTNGFTRALLIIQFSLSVIALIGGVIFIRNDQFQKKINFGYEYGKILSVDVNGEQQFIKLKKDLSENPAIKEFSVAGNHIGPYAAYYRTLKIDTSEFKGNIYEIGHNYFKTLGMKILIGRDFNANSREDREEAAIIDENFARRYKLVNPLGQQIFYGGKYYHVIGIVQNHLDGLKDIGRDYFYKLANPRDYRKLIIQTSNISGTVDFIKTKWKALFPGTPCQIDLQKETLFEEADGYNVNLGRIFLFLTILGNILSCSGIYAMTSLNVQRRTKEIGVRRVLGASVFHIIRIVNKEFAVILLTAVILGGIGGYYASEFLLGSLYAIFLHISPWEVLLGSLLIFIIGTMITAVTIRNTALLNPSNTLRIQ